MLAAVDVVPAADPTPLTTAFVVGVGNGPFGPVLALLGTAGLAGGGFADIFAISFPGFELWHFVRRKGQISIE